MKDYYKILGVKSAASEDDIKKSYRQLAKVFHPDISSSPDANRIFALVNEAYETLIDPEKRQQYDRQLQRIATGLPQYSTHHKRSDKKYGSRKGDPYFRFARYAIRREKKVTTLDKTLFATMLIIAILFISFSIIDLLSDQWDTIINGLTGLLSGISFLIILIYGWNLYSRR